MITKEMFMTAYRDGFIKIEPDDDERYVTICDVGGVRIFLELETYKGERLKSDVLTPAYELIQEIGAGENYVPDGIYLRCEGFLRGRYPDMAKAQDERALALKSASDEELVHELLRRKSRVSDFSIQSFLKNSSYIAGKMWSREDVGGMLAEMGYSDSEENIALVINTGFLTSLNDCNDEDWKIIVSAIHECESKLEPKRFAAFMQPSPESENKARGNLLDARMESFETMDLFGKTVLFTDMRVDPATVPKGMYLYGLRHGDDDSEPITAECGVVAVNHFGDFLSDKPFDFPDADNYLVIGKEDWGYLSDTMTVEEYLSRDKKVHP